LPKASLGEKSKGGRVRINKSEGQVLLALESGSPGSGGTGLGVILVGGEWFF